jgi:hypothetical protein
MLGGVTAQLSLQLLGPDISSTFQQSKYGISSISGTAFLIAAHLFDQSSSTLVTRTISLVSLANQLFRSTGAIPSHATCTPSRAQHLASYVSSLGREQYVVSLYRAFAYIIIQYIE